MNRRGIFFYSLLLFSCAIRNAQAEKHHLEDYQEYFSDILLVIHFNHPYFQNIEFEKELYSPVFKNIVFYGDRTELIDKGESLHVNEDGNHGAYHIVYTRNGYYYSKVIKDVLKRYPGYSGYIFMQDDVLFQFWHFTILDKNQIWYGENVREKFFVNHIKHHPELGWWGTSIGIDEVRKILPHLTPTERKHLDDNFGKNSFGYYFCDFFYMPGHLARRSLQLCDYLSKVWCDIAATTILGCQEDLKTWEALPHWWACYDSGGGAQVIKNYKPQYFWMHPIKYSTESNRQFIRKVFKEQFYDKLEHAHE